MRQVRLVGRWNANVAAGALLAALALGIGLDASANWLGAGFLLFGAAVAVPLVLALVDPAGACGTPRGRFAVARWLHVPAAACLAAALSLPAGATAGVCTLPWLAFTALVALLGVLRLAARGGGPAGEVAIDAGLVFLAVGGVWTTASRTGTNLMGFAEPWLLLTAAHFHFAGLVLPVVTGLCARVVEGRRATLASAGVVIGVPLVAAGITAGARGLRTCEWLAAVWLALAALAVVALLLAVCRRAGRPSAAIAVGTAAAGLLAGMSLVLVYATTVWLGTPRLSIGDMLATHAPIQVLGFALPALLGLRLLALPAPPPGMQVLVPWLGDVPDPDAWRVRGFGPQVAEGDDGFAEDRHEVELPREPPGAPLADGPFRAAARLVLSYRAFPATELQSLRMDAAAPVAVGETVAARYAMFMGIHIVFAARVVAVFDAADAREHRAGFTYRTLAGHPECGDETFAVRKELATGRVFATIVARSRPGTPLVRWLRRLARRRQLRAGRAAVENLRRHAAASALERAAGPTVG